MLAKAIVGAALTVGLLAAWLAGELRFLAPYRDAIWRQYADLIGAVTLAVFVNLCAFYYTLARWLFLRDTGRKLRHLDRQLAPSDAALDDGPSPGRGAR